MMEDHLVLVMCSPLIGEVLFKLMAEFSESVMKNSVTIDTRARLRFK